LLLIQTLSCSNGTILECFNNYIMLLFLKMTIQFAQSFCNIHHMVTKVKAGTICVPSLQQPPASLQICK